MPAFRKKPRACHGLNCAAARRNVDRMSSPVWEVAGTHDTSTPASIWRLTRKPTMARRLPVCRYAPVPCATQSS